MSADAPLTLLELERAVWAMSNNKTPGSDGLPAEFYKKFWFIIGKWILDCFNAAFEGGKLGPEQRRVIITLVPKKDKDRRKLNNWRPIALLNTDYRILAKTIYIIVFRILYKVSFIRIRLDSWQKDLLVLI